MSGEVGRDIIWRHGGRSPGETGAAVFPRTDVPEVDAMSRCRSTTRVLRVASMPLLKPSLTWLGPPVRGTPAGSGVLARQGLRLDVARSERPRVWSRIVKCKRRTECGHGR